MKKKLQILLATVLIGTSAIPNTNTTYSQEAITVTLNNNLVDCSQQAPLNQNGRVLVPLRAIFEALNATVNWNNDLQKVTATTPTTTFEMVIGNQAYYVNGQEFISDVPAQIINGSTMVPVRVVSESLGCEVSWDNNNQRVLISSGSQSTEQASANQGTVSITVHYLDSLDGDDYSIDNLQKVIDVPYGSTLGSLNLENPRNFFSGNVCNLGVGWGLTDGGDDILSNDYQFTSNASIASFYEAQMPSRPETLLQTKEEKDKAALEVAQRIATGSKAGDEIATLMNAMGCVYSYYANGSYADSGSNYSIPYGVFVVGESSCAGVTRAMGLVLDCLGYEWEHINENQWSHQWVELTLSDGMKFFIDAQAGFMGETPHPYQAEMDMFNNGLIAHN